MISKEFQENINEGDLITVRSALLDDLIIDRTFKKFDEDFKAANDKLDILVPYDGEPLEMDTEKWNMDYLNLQKVELMINFSKERIEHLKAVIVKVMPPNKVKKEKKYVSSQNQTIQLHQKKEKGSGTGSSLTGTRKINETEIRDEKCESKEDGKALIIGGTITTAVGIAIAQPVVIGVGVAIVGAGVYTKANNRR